MFRPLIGERRSVAEKSGVVHLIVGMSLRYIGKVSIVLGAAASIGSAVEEQRAIL